MSLYYCIKQIAWLPVTMNHKYRIPCDNKSCPLYHSQIASQGQCIKRSQRVCYKNIFHHFHKDDILSSRWSHVLNNYHRQQFQRRLAKTTGNVEILTHSSLLQFEIFLAYPSQMTVLQSRHVAKFDESRHALQLATDKFLPIWWHL